MIETYPGVPRVLIIPGLDGSTGLWRSVATTVLPGLRPLWFDHSQDRAADGFDGLAQRALEVLDADNDCGAPAYICGESFGGPVALTLARQNPHRVRGLILLSPRRSACRVQWPTTAPGLRPPSRQRGPVACASCASNAGRAAR